MNKHISKTVFLLVVNSIFMPFEVSLFAAQASETSHSKPSRSNTLRSKKQSEASTVLLAIRRNDTASLAKLLRNCESADKVDIQKKTPLVLAIEKGQSQHAHMLLNFKADFSIKDCDGNTALLLAASKGYTGIVEHILTGAFSEYKPLVGYDPKSKDLSFYTETTIAPDMYDHNPEGSSAFMLAAKGNHAETALLLMDYLADINEQDAHGNSPCMQAACEGRADMVQSLIAMRADLTLKNKAGRTAFDCADLHNQKDSIKVLMQHDPSFKDEAQAEGRTQLQIAAQKGYHAAVQLLLAENVDKCQLTRRDKKGNTALMLAAEAGKKECVATLIPLVANIELKALDGNTAFECAVYSGDHEVVKLFLDKELFLEKGLYIAAEEGYTSIVRLLKEHGADIDAILLKACEKVPSERMARTLVACGASPFLKDHKGIALACMVGKKDTETMKFLLKVWQKGGEDLHGSILTETSKPKPDIDKVASLLARNASVHARDHQSNALIHKAVLLKNIELVRFLHSQGACLKSVNSDYQTPYTQAVSNLKKGGDDAEFVSGLLALGAQTEYLGPDSQSALTRSKIAGTYNQVQLAHELYKKRLRGTITPVLGAKGAELVAAYICR